MRFTKLYDIVRQPLRYIILQGGTSAAKTYTTLQYLAIYATNHPKTTITVVAETLPHLKRGALRDFRKITSTDGFQVQVLENKTDYIFTFANGSIVEFFSADADSKMRGARRDILYINECNNITMSAFDELDVRTSIKTILDFNPVRRFWVHDKLIPILKEGDFVFYKATYKDAVDSLGNSVLLQSVIDNIERRKDNANWWKVYGEGEVGSVEGLIFSNWSIVTDEMPGTLIGYGIDFGFTHSPTALIQVNESNGELFVDELLYKTGLQNDQLWEFVNKYGVKLRELAIGDSAEPKTIDYLFRKGWAGLKQADKGPDSVEFGINLLLERKVNITRRSVNLIKEFRQYEWDKNKDGAILPRPIKEFDHGIDAIRYLYSYPKKRKLLIAGT
jgi:phage terminase large subunit